MDPVFPGKEWERASPSEAGFDEERLAAVEETLDAVDPDPDDDPRHLEDFADENPYRVAVVRDGRLVAEWNRGIDPDEHVALMSAAKSIFSTILGIVSEEGIIPSADAKLADFFPEALGVLPGEGPKEGRHARHKDREITLKQLASNTSGYLKPGEQPGEVKHYQTHGMNVLSHAMASAYNMYDVDDPEGSPDLELLIDTRLRIPLRAHWSYTPGNHEPRFGYYAEVEATAPDMARLGWLWCNYGYWDGVQIVPEEYMREATSVQPAEREADPWRNMLETYGIGFWTNEQGALWPSLPKDSFAALGAGGMVIWACPSLSLVVVEGPGPFYRGNLGELVSEIVDAIED